MKFNKYNFLKAGVLLAVVGFTATSCQEDDARSVAIKPGKTLSISGSSTAYVGDEKEYYLLMNKADADYSWSIESGATITENSENDAYVDVLFTDPADYTLSVSEGEAAGSKAIKVISKEISFSADSAKRSEMLVNDTITIELDIPGGINGDGKIAYTIGGSMDPSRYFILPRYESPLDFADTISSIKVVVTPEEEVGSEDLIFTLGAITETELAEEYVKADTLQTIVYTFMDDTKMASIDTATVTITSAGVYEFPVMLSNASNSEVTVDYGVSVAIGVNDATPNNSSRELVFEAGETEKSIVLSISDNAFSTDRTVTITLDGVSGDDEASLKTNYVEKTIMIKAAD
ncbi:hypothetical protein [Marinoscillum furvescens]|uniref:Calx-beta domain-containing protein n=1 Tax=Marinoscillum furvescens DSM 4134 TaxID=1122208 RepID=A0A3D9KYE2_MARFU|nr:hypothetical protein [Marinoscillum furvescens]RED92629.1 hypothetical protein C7460_12916 [Marinoscillum furvescens DSM 4134]